MFRYTIAAWDVVKGESANDVELSIIAPNEAEADVIAEDMTPKREFYKTIHVEQISIDVDYTGAEAGQ